MREGHDAPPGVDADTHGVGADPGVSEDPPGGEARGSAPPITLSAPPLPKYSTPDVLGHGVTSPTLTLPKLSPPNVSTDSVTATLIPSLRRTPMADAHLELTRSEDERLRREAQRTVTRAARAAEIDDAGVPVDGGAVDERGVPVGWDAVEYNVAKDARRPMKTSPMYLAMMLKVHESYQRAEAERPAVAELGADIRVYLTQNVYNYPVRDVTDREK